MKNLSFFMGLSLLTLTLACSHAQSERDLDQKLQADKALPSNEDLALKMKSSIATNPALSDDQRAKLLDLQKRTQSQLSDLRNQSFKLRDLLISDLSMPDYNQDEVITIKGRLKDIETQRLNVIFEAVDKANKLMGREIPNRHFILREMGPVGE